jgi:chromosome segregation ATPase
MEQLVQLAQAIGFPAVAVLVVLLVYKDRNKANDTTELTLAKIAGDSTSQIANVYKEMGGLRQELGMAQGQVIVIQDNFRTEQGRWQSGNESLKDKLRSVQETVERQTITISRHEGRIAELEGESKRKDEIIASKEHELVGLTEAKARLEVTVNNQTEQIESLNRKIGSLTAPVPKSLDETIPIPEIPATVTDVTTPEIPSENPSL